MTNESVKQLLEYSYKRPETAYRGTTKYVLAGQTYNVPQSSVPTFLVRRMLIDAYYDHFCGLMIVGGMGKGKTTAVQDIVHHLHTEAKELFVEDHKLDWNFNIVWAGLHEFLNQQKFYSELPKVPTIVVYDDISGASDKVSGSELAANFNALTTIRHTLGGIEGLIPSIVIASFHYSLDMEKKIRSQLGYMAYTGVSKEEADNVNRMGIYHSSSYRILKQFRSIATTMRYVGKFYLRVGNGRSIEFPFQKPFRPLAVINDDWSGIILYSNKAVCDFCSQTKKKVRKILPVKELYELIKNGVYRHAGIKALQHIAINRGYSGAADDYLVRAINHLERDVLPTYDFDWNDMVAEIRKRNNWVEGDKRRSQRVQKEIEFNQKLDEIAIPPKDDIIDIPPLVSGLENPHP